MGDPLKRVQPGDPLKIPAETFNTFIDAAADFKARTRGFVQKATPQALRNALPVSRTGHRGLQGGRLSANRQGQRWFLPRLRQGGGAGRAPGGVLGNLSVGSGRAGR